MITITAMPFKKREESLTSWWPALKSYLYYFLIDYKFKIGQWNQRNRVTCKREMLATHTYAQLCVIIRHMTSCSWLECVNGLCGDTLTNHNSPCDKLWHKIVHKCVSPAFLQASVHIQTVSFAVWSTNYCLNKIGVQVGKERQKIIFSL